MSEYDQPPPQTAAPIPIDGPILPEVPIPAVPIPGFPAGVPSPEASVVAHGHYGEDDAHVSATGQAHARPSGAYAGVDGQGHYSPAPGVTMDANVGVNTQQGAHADGTAQAGPSDGTHVQVAAGTSTQQGPYARGGARVGDPANHIDVNATTANGGSIHGSMAATDDQYSVTAEGGVDQITTDPNGNFRVNVNAIPVPGANLGVSASGQNLGQPNATGNVQGYAHLPVGNHAAVTANGGATMGPDGTTYQMGAGIQGNPTPTTHAGVNVQVSDPNRDDVPDVTVTANAGGTF